MHTNGINGCTWADTPCDKINGSGRVAIRTPRLDDILGIVTVVRACEPFLTAHMSYIYWMNVRHHGDTCAVAELDGEIVGWCSILPVSGGKYFLHQLGVAPKVRGLGIAESLFAYQLDKLGLCPTGFELEFTIDPENGAALNLMKAIAHRSVMQVSKKPDVVHLVEDCREELYVMKPYEEHN